MDTSTNAHSSRTNDSSPDSQELGQFIPLPYHYHLLSDEARLTAFREAIDNAVQPGATVLELGGGTGVLSFFAAQKARKVYCVERIGELVDAARGFLDANGVGSRVEVVQVDAHDYLPPEPVDVVICELLHVALLREKQVPVLQSFKQRYIQKFGPKQPKFVPELSFLAFQPVEQAFSFHGYVAPVPIFQAPAPEHDGTQPLGDPTVYFALDYHEPFPETYTWQGSVPIGRAGTLNAIRFITKNVVGVIESEGRAAEWSNQYLVLPLPKPMAVLPGQQLDLSFSYQAGAPLEALTGSLVANLQTTAIPLSRVA